MIQVGCRDAGADLKSREAEDRTTHSSLISLSCTLVSIRPSAHVQNLCTSCDPLIYGTMKQGTPKTTTQEFPLSEEAALSGSVSWPGNGVVFY